MRANQTLTRPTTPPQTTPDQPAAPRPVAHYSSKRPRPGSKHASRPRIAQDITRIVAVAEQLADSTGNIAKTSDIANKVADVLAETQRHTNLQQTVTNASVDAANAVVNNAVEQHAAVLAKHAGQTTTPEHCYRHPNSQRAMLKQAGHPNIKATDNDLQQHCSRQAAADLVKHRQLLKHSKTVQQTQDQLGQLWNGTTEPRSLDDTIAEHTRNGIDAERLAMGAIRYEALRHDNLLWKQANDLARRFGRHPADLRGWGWQGLITALRRYDPDMCLFSTYAVPKISGAIRDGIRGEDPLPKRLTTFRRKVNTVTETLATELGRTPTLAELAETLDAPEHHMKLIPRLDPAASIDHITDNTTHHHTPDPLKDRNDPADTAVANTTSAAILEAVAALPQEEADAVRMLILEDRPLTEVRQTTGATTRQLRLRQRRGLHTLRETLADWA